ncbi:MAG: 4-hydroxy-tetrahydrodipicolinate reductase [Alphaproteobacteria bacterium]|jgi:4-hydroxy-tetrahydrodipicolinate reductase|nr:4-hydroxy-tetrahydrodipicolinate reductase [Alphaproteobacteria bacterium]
MIRVGVLGSKGRMGQAIMTALANHPRCNLSVAGTRDNIESLFEASDVVIDFTSADALPNHLDLSLKHMKPLVVGTTGLQPHHKQLLPTLATKVPLVVSSNTSIGITILTSLVEKAAHALGEDFDIEISELHHRHKKDAPSGTALMLGQAAAKGRGKSLKTLQCSHHTTGTRKQGTIGFSVQRGGSIIGDHCVRLIGEEEMLELSHRGLSRSVYANGALHAARWLLDQKPGLYSMKDVLGL